MLSSINHKNMKVNITGAVRVYQGELFTSVYPCGAYRRDVVLWNVRSNKQICDFSEPGRMDFIHWTVPLSISEVRHEALTKCKGTISGKDPSKQRNNHLNQLTIAAKILLNKHTKISDQVKKSSYPKFSNLYHLPWNSYDILLFMYIL